MPRGSKAAFIVLAQHPRVVEVDGDDKARPAPPRRVRLGEFAARFRRYLNHGACYLPRALPAAPRQQACRASQHVKNFTNNFIFCKIKSMVMLF